MINSNFFSFRFINLKSSKNLTILESNIKANTPLKITSYKQIIPNFFKNSKNILKTDNGVDYLKIIDYEKPENILNGNSIFLAGKIVTISNSLIEGALIHIISDEMSMHTSDLRAIFQTTSNELQTLSYFEDVCGENGGNNFNLGGLALPKIFETDPKAKDLTEEDKDKIKMCKFKSIASESNLIYQNILDLIKTGSIGTISKQVPCIINTAGVISILSNHLQISPDSFLYSKVTKKFSKEYYGSPSGGSAIFITSHFDFSGLLSVEGVDSSIFYNGAGSGGNIFIYNPLWIEKNKKERNEISGDQYWKIKMSGGERPEAKIDGLKSKYFKAENGMVYTSFCPSGTSSVFCVTCPEGIIFIIINKRSKK